MKRVFTSFICLAFWTAAAGMAAAGSRPNILLVMTDQQTRFTMGATGNPFVKTPAMDRMAASGVTFLRSYCTSPVCGPARSSIVTGRMPSETGVELNTAPIAESIPTVGELLRGAGYDTYWAGKWHLPEDYFQREHPEGGEFRGFDFLPMKHPESGSWVLGAEVDPLVTDSVRDFLDSRERDRPFFLGVSYHNPHDICMYPGKAAGTSLENPEIQTRFGPVRLPDVVARRPEQAGVLPPLPPNHVPAPDEPEFIQEKRTFTTYGLELEQASDFSEAEWRGYLDAYYRLTEMVDGEIATLLEAFERRGLLENTIVVFTSDHGDGAAAQRWAAKLSLYEEAALVPMIWSWPGRIPAGVQNDEHLVSQIDVVPTLLDFAGVQTEARFTGSSLRSILEGGEKTWRNHVVVELADYKPDPSRRGRMVRTDRYKYNVFSSGARNEQLFDLSRDPGETQNLAAEPLLREVVAEHRQILKAWTRSISDDFPLDEYLRP